MAITRADVLQKARDLGFHKAGIAIVPSTPATHERLANQALQRWLEQGYAADMAWMNNPKRQDVRQVLPGVRSVISVALNYYTPHQHPEGKDYGKISRYGWGRDYHRVMQKRLKALAQWLEAIANPLSYSPSPQTSPDPAASTSPSAVQVRYYVDTGPVQDKFWAQQAGLGWIAKNGNLITREYGSWVFLGTLLTTLDLQPDAAHTSHCGTCTRCLTACPTAAIPQPYVVDANRCIAYHTIENREETLPPAIAKNLNGWVAGCDICQDVCPWNQRFAQPTDISDFHPYPWHLAPPLTTLTQLSEAAWDQRLSASALRRIKPFMWRRNAQAAQQSVSSP